MDDDHSSGADADEQPRSRGIYLLPNLFTTATLFGGFYAIIAAIRGEYEAAAVAIFAAMVADTLDGRVARLTNTASDFGKEYDSLSDMVTFGLAAGTVMYVWSLQFLPDQVTIALRFSDKLAWLAAFFYVACTALRLARFNVSAHLAGGKGVFYGLPSPSAAGLMAGFVWVCVDLDIDGASVAIPAVLVTVLAAGLMVSNIRYISFKDLNLAQRVPFLAVIAVVGVFVLVSLDPPKVSFAAFAGYALSGPVMHVLRRRRKRKL